MIETREGKKETPSSSAATVSIYLLRSFIVSNVRGSLIYIFGGLKLCYYVLCFSRFIRSFVRPFVSPYVRN